MSSRAAYTPPRSAHALLSGGLHDTELKGKRVYRWRCVRISRRTLLSSIALAVCTLLASTLSAGRVCRSAAQHAARDAAVDARGSMGTGFIPARIDAAAVARSCTPAAGAAAPMVVLVTGSAGFIGFHAARALRREGHGVVGLDNFNSYYSVALKKARAAALAASGVHTVAADLNDAQALRQLLQQCHVTHVLHLAAQAGVRYAVKNPAAYVHSNVAGFVTLLEVMKAQSVPPALVFASSSSVYGLNAKVPFAESDRTDAPASLYAATKKADELLAHTYAHIYGLRVTALRYFTVYGPWGRPDMAAYAFSRAILAGKPVRIFQGPGGSELSRDFTYVDDVVAGTLAALRASPLGGATPAPQPLVRVYNLGNTRPVNVSYFVSCLEGALGTPALRQHVAVPPTGDVLHTHADVARATSELGYAPTVPLEEGMRRFADWFLSYYGDGRHASDMRAPPADRRRARALRAAPAAQRQAWGEEEEEEFALWAEGEDPWRADGE